MAPSHIAFQHPQHQEEEVEYSQILAHYENRQPEILQIIRLLVEQETPSDDKIRLDAFAQLLAGRYGAVGATVKVIENEARGNHVRAVFADPAYVSDLDAKPALILCH